MTERTLVRKVLAGDQRAADRLVRENYPAVLRFLILVTRSREDAQDLAQQTFLKAKSSLADFRFESRLRTWLFGIAYHEYTHWMRTVSREIVGLDLEGTCELSDDAIVLQDAIGSLPELHREAFVLREIDRLSVREAAIVLDVPEGTVKSRCAEARALLIRRLASTYGTSNQEPCEAESGP